MGGALHFTHRQSRGAWVYWASDGVRHYSFVVLPGMRIFATVFSLDLEPLRSIDWTGFRSHPDEMKRHLQEVAP